MLQSNQISDSFIVLIKFETLFTESIFLKLCKDPKVYKGK